MKEEEIEEQSEEYLKQDGTNGEKAFDEILKKYPFFVKAKNEEEKEELVKLLCNYSKEVWKDGAKWGIANAIEWHDPRDDFPEDKRKGDEFYCKLKDETLDMEWYEVLIWDIEYQTEDIYQVPVNSMFKSLKTGKDVSDYVIAWSELPQFKE